MIGLPATGKISIPEIKHLANTTTEEGDENMDRYTARRIVNDLIDMLIIEGVSKQQIISMLDEDDYYSDADKEYFDITWLYKQD